MKNIFLRYCKIGTGTCRSCVGGWGKLLRSYCSRNGFSHLPIWQSWTGCSNYYAGNYQSNVVLPKNSIQRPKEFVGSKIELKTQGLRQGNGAVPRSWCVISIMILWVHGAKGHGAKFIAPMSKVWGWISAILFVDDMDVLHFNMETPETVYEVHRALQSADTNWRKLIIATGGSVCV